MFLSYKDIGFNLDKKEVACEAPDDGRCHFRWTDCVVGDISNANKIIVGIDLLDNLHSPGLLFASENSMETYGVNFLWNWMGDGLNGHKEHFYGIKQA